VNRSDLGAHRIRVEAEVADLVAVDKDHGDAFEVIAQQALLGIDVDLGKAEAQAFREQLLEAGARLIAEVALRAAVKRDFGTRR
jgi:hypothetical protein